MACSTGSSMLPDVALPRRARLLPLLLLLLLVFLSCPQVRAARAGTRASIHAKRQLLRGGSSVEASVSATVQFSETNWPEPSNPAVQVLWFWGSPETVTWVGQGETVQWIWWDSKEHSVEGQGGAAAALFTGQGGGSSTVKGRGFLYNVTFNEPGEYRYHCHVYKDIMVGVVRVQPRENPGGTVIPWFDGVSVGAASTVIEEGDTVTWQWDDELPHSLVSVSADDGLFTGPGSVGEPVAEQGFEYNKTFDRAGTFLYLCAQHGERMRGNITVVPKGALTDPGSEDGTTPAPAPPGFETTPVQILWFFGAPQSFSSIGQGETVQWIWWDSKEHSVEGTGAAKGLFTGPGGGSNTLAQNKFIYNYTFDQPGEFTYQCHNHTVAMTGTVSVKPKMNVGGVALPWYDGVSYGGASAIIEEGDTVTWQWGDDLTHSLLSATGDSSLFTGPGSVGQSVTENGFEYKKKFDKAGEYLYICAEHGDTMKGNITVLAKGASLPPPSPEPSTGPPQTPPAPAGPTSGSVTIKCSMKSTWESGGVTSAQYDCTLSNTMTVPVTGITLSCSNFKPTQQWNINPDCSLPNPSLSPGQTLNLGFIATSAGASGPSPSIAVSSYSAATPGITVLPSQDTSCPVSLNCSATGTPWVSAGKVVYQYECVALNGGTSPVTQLQLQCQNFEPSQSWNINADCSVSAEKVYPGQAWTFGFQTSTMGVSMGVQSCSNTGQK